LVSNESATLHCARHPGTETVLRCGRCETPICPRCLVSTPVGARCPNCAQVKRFNLLLKPREVVRAVSYGVLTATLGTAIALSIPLLGPLILLAVVGFAVGEVVSIGGNRKRVPALGPIAVGCLLVGYDLGLAALGVLGGGPISVGMLLVPILALRNFQLLIGLLLGALLAWMRVK
jgi:hypothetical protein